MVQTRKVQILSPEWDERHRGPTREVGGGGKKRSRLCFCEDLRMLLYVALGGKGGGMAVMNIVVGLIIASPSSSVSQSVSPVSELVRRAAQTTMEE